MPNRVENIHSIEAFKRLQGDDKKLTSDYKKRNREERKAWESGQLSFSLRVLEDNRAAIERGYEHVDEVREGSVAAVQEKATRYAALQQSVEMVHARRLADAWCAAFVWPKREGAPDAITQEVFVHLTQDAHALSAQIEKEIERIASRYDLFHWDLAFPDVFGEEGTGGFDVVLGNPPWEHTELKEQEWFATRRPDIAAAPGAKRKRMIEALAGEDPALYRAFIEDLRLADGFSQFVRSSKRFPLCGRGRINTYAIFAETNREIISPTGRVGCIVPSGIATDNTTKDFFGDLVRTKTLATLYDFENRKNIFPGVGHGRFKFCLLTMAGEDRPVQAANFSFFALDVADLKDPERRFPLSTEDIQLLNPNTRTCPIFRSRRDAEITKSIYRRVPVLIDENKNEGNPWSISLKQGLFNMTSDSGLFRTREDLEADGWMLEENIFYRESERLLPLYEAKMIHHYDHRYGDYALRPKGSLDTELPQVPTELLLDHHYAVLPRYWVAEAEVERRLANQWDRRWFLGFRSIGRSTDVRTMISTIFPRFAVSGKLQLIIVAIDETRLVPCFMANLNSFVFDFCTRQKLGGTDLAFHYVKQFPVLHHDGYGKYTGWRPAQTLRDWITPRVLELTYTAWDLEPFARDHGYEGPPFRWDPERRFLLRCELDAAFFHLYGIDRDDVDYIMETFPIVKRKDQATHGEYRTKRVILTIYDHMARAAETGQPYQTLLDPPPAELDLATSEPATVMPLRPREERPYLGSDESRPAPIAAEEQAPYGTGVKKAAREPLPEQPQNLLDATHEPKNSSQPSPEHHGDANEPTPDQSSGIPPEATLFPDNEVETKNTIPSIEEAALALHACVPDGEKVQRERLLLDAARELGHTKLTKKVRRSLNKALNAEHNKKRLKTDWQLVWKPRKR